MVKILSVFTKRSLYQAQSGVYKNINMTVYLKSPLWTLTPFNILLGLITYWSKRIFLRLQI